MILYAVALPRHRTRRARAGAGRGGHNGRHPSGFGLDRLEVVEDARADQLLDLGADLHAERRFKPHFSAPRLTHRFHKRVLTLLAYRA